MTFYTFKPDSGQYEPSGRVAFSQPKVPTVARAKMRPMVCNIVFFVSRESESLKMTDWCKDKA